MGITASRSSSKKRLFINYPLRRGMYYGNLITNEGQCKLSVNYDSSTSGEEGFPRPSFVNSILHNGFNSVFMPEHVIKQTTNIGPTFLIGAYSTVNEDDYTSSEIDDTVVLEGEYHDPFNLKFISLGSATTQFTNRADLIKVNISTDGAYDGDTIWVYKDGETETEKFKIRPLGIDAPEIDGLTYTGDYVDGIYFTNHVVTYAGRGYRCIEAIDATTPPDTDPDHWETFYGFEARNYLQTILDAAEGSFYIMFDEFSEQEDAYERKLVYLFYESSQGADPVLVNADLIINGYANLAYIDDHYKFYDDLRSALNTATSESMRMFGDNISAVPTEDYTAAVIQDASEFEGDESTGLTYFKQKVYTDVTINSTIYSSKSFYDSTPTAHQFVDSAGSDVTLDEDITIQFLAHNYEAQEYEFVQRSKEIPHANMPWRNAITFFGRIIEDSIVRYKGLITLQYGRLNQGDALEFFVLVQEPYEVNLGTFNNEDPYSIAYNALDDDPYIFEDYVGTSANAWIRPSVLGVVIYKENDDADNQFKVANKVNPSGDYFIKPYWALPNITSTKNPGYLGTQIRVLVDDKPLMIGDNADGWEPLWTSANAYASTDMSTGSAFKGRWDFSNSNGKPIKVEMCTEIYDKSIVKDSTTGSYDFCTTSLDFSREDKVLVQEEKTFTIETTTFNAVSQSGTTVFQDRIKIVMMDNTNGDTMEAMFYGTNQTGTGTIYNIFHTGEELKITLGKYTYTMTITDPTLVDDDDDRTEIWNSEIDYEVWIASNTSHPLIVQEEQLIDPKNLLTEHNVWNATNIARLDRYLILYGGAMGSHSLQFLEFDTTDFAPFPYGQIMFDSEIIHVHPHMGMLYVFCDDGLWILHGGLSYNELIKTFAYSGVKLAKTEKKTVVSYGNEVFFMNNNKGYVVRANQYVESSNDVYVIEITQAVNGILGTPNKFIQERLQNSYEILIEDTTNLSVNYFVKVVNTELNLIASYHLDDPIDALMVTYIYNKDRKTWKVYDTVAGSFPLYTINSSNIKGYDLILANRYETGFITYASYLYELPNADALEQRLGDARSVVYLNEKWELADSDADVTKALIPIQTMLDSGSLDLSSLHKKRVREYTFKFNNPNAVEFLYRVIPFMDGIPHNNAVTVAAIIDEFGNVIEQLLQDNDQGEIETKDIVVVQVNELGGTSLIDTKFTTLSTFGVQLGTNLVGYMPGFQIYIPAKDTFNIQHYSIRYRQFGAR